MHDLIPDRELLRGVVRDLETDDPEVWRTAIIRLMTYSEVARGDPHLVTLAKRSGYADLVAARRMVLALAEYLARLPVGFG